MSGLNHLGDCDTRSDSASESEASESTLSSSSVSTPILDVELEYNLAFTPKNETDDLDEHFDLFAYGLDEDELAHNENQNDDLDDLDERFYLFAYGLEEGLEINHSLGLYKVPVVATQFFADRPQCMSPEPLSLAIDCKDSSEYFWDWRRCDSPEPFGLEDN